MISVSQCFEEYCDKCPEIEPVAVNSVMWADGEPYLVEIVVKCAHAKKCKAIYKSMKGEQR